MFSNELNVNENEQQHLRRINALNYCRWIHRDFTALGHKGSWPPVVQGFAIATYFLSPGSRYRYLLPGAAIATYFLPTSAGLIRGGDITK